MSASVVLANAIRVDNSVVACSLVARFLRDRLGCEVVDSASAPLRRARYDTLILVNSPWGFCSEEHRVRVRSLLWSAKRVVWVQNDYNSGIGPRSFKSMGAWLDGDASFNEFPSKQFNPQYSPIQPHRAISAQTGRSLFEGEVRFLTLWTTIPAYVERGYVTPKIPLGPRSAYVNWNALHYQPLRGLSHVPRPGPPSLFYYGSHRPGRGERFRRYLGGGDGYTVMISTAVGRSVQRFKVDCPGATIEAREQSLVARLAREWATVYIEDERADELYCSPAARFYEALSAGCAQFIDADAVPNLERAGFRIDPAWVVRDCADVAAKLRRAPMYALDQRAAWATARIRRQLNSEVALALRGLERRSP